MNNRKVCSKGNDNALTLLHECGVVRDSWIFSNYSQKDNSIERQVQKGKKGSCLFGHVTFFFISIELPFWFCHLSLRVILLVYRRLLSFWSCHVMYRIVVSYRSNRYLLGVGLQKVYCQFGLLLSSFFLLDRFIPNFGNLLNLISLSITGYFRSYLFKFYFMYFFP
jgi:hypothetical protein